MYVNNLIHPSDFVTLVPVGLPTTLEYNELGLLKKVYMGYADKKVDISDEIFKYAKVTAEVKPFPFNLKLTGGTSWVEGVIYCPMNYDNTYGRIADNIKDEFMSLFAEFTEMFHFFAANIRSGAANFVGAANIRRWLDSNGFDVLPGFLAPVKMTRAAFIENVHHCKYNLNYPRIMQYIIFRMDTMIYADTDISQYKVKSVSKFLSEDGTIKAHVKVYGDYPEIDIHWSDVVKHDIQANTMMVFDNQNNIIHCNTTDDKKREKRSDMLTCEFCGKTYRVTDKFVGCPEEDCTSRMYPRLVKLLRTLGLPIMTFDDFMTVIKKDKAMTIVDFLDIEPYADMNITCSLKEVLIGLVPAEIVRDEKMFGLFVNQCNNNPATVLFYLNHPDKIATDLNLPKLDTERFIEWLNRGCHAKEIEMFINHNHVDIHASMKKFDGAPIFHGKTIMITGRFKHGSHDEIISILESYDATVVTKFNNSVQCLVIGDTKESIDGLSARYCKANKIPIFTESAFFKRFQIDEDISLYLG